MAYRGFKPGRWIQFYNEDVPVIREKVAGLDKLAPRNSLGGWRGGNNVVRKNKTGAFSLFGDYPDYQAIQIVTLTRGRHINEIDIRENRKIAVIGQNVQDVLFEKGEDPIGDYIRIQGVYFKVVGIFGSQRTGEQGSRDEQTIYLPFTTFQQAFKFGNRIGWFGFTVKEGFKAVEVEDGIKKVLMNIHDVHPDDVGALGSENLEKEFGQITGLFAGISLFNWIVGIGTLLAGMIGVSNIMLIIVKERTKEIGIRKSIGATPLSIVSLIIQESIVLTAIAGYTGLVFGTFLMEGVRFAMNKFGMNDGMFRDPGIDLNIALLAFSILIVCGALAGLVPAHKAAKISPTEAIRQE
jgi:putative ABC transport system permease protein